MVRRLGLVLVLESEKERFMRNHPGMLNLYSPIIPRFGTLLTVFALLHIGLTASLRADDEPTATQQEADLSLGLHVRVLERDLTSRDYRDVVDNMIPTDLEAEWERVATPDNHVTFLKKHGGKEKVYANRELKAAYEKRVQLANRFLKLMRAAYRNRGVKRAPFDQDDELETLFREASQSATGGDAAPEISVRVVMPAAGSERQWPRFRGPSGQGTAIETEFPSTWSQTENVAWRAKLPGVGNSSPVIWDDRLFVTAASEDGSQRLLLCYRRTDGQKLWERAAPAASAQEKLYWKNTYASSTPVTDGENVIVFFGNSGLVCYDMDGQLKWQQTIGPFPTMHGPGTSPVMYKNKVIFIQYQNRGQSQFVAFDKNTGDELWHPERPHRTCWSTPVVLRVGDHDELVYNGSHQVVGYNPETGEELWQVSGSTAESIPTIVVGGGLIFSASGRNGPTMAIRPGGSGDVTETHVVWQNRRGAPHVPSPVYYRERLYFVNDTGIVTCLNAMTGRTLWQKRLRGRFSMSPIEADGKLILTNEVGNTYILEAGDEFSLLAENDLAEPILATPALLGGRLYFRARSELICVGQ